MEQPRCDCWYFSWKSFPSNTAQGIRSSILNGKPQALLAMSKVVRPRTRTAPRWTALESTWASCEHTHTKAGLRNQEISAILPSSYHINMQTSRENYQLFWCCDNDGPLLCSRNCLRVLYLVLFNKVKEVHFNKYSISFNFLREIHSKRKWKDKINGSIVLFKH